MVEGAEVGLCHPPPQQPDDDEARGPGEKEEPARQRSPAEAAVQPDREAKRNDRRDDDYARGPDDCPEQRPAKWCREDEGDVGAEAAERLEVAELIDAEK